MPHSNAVNSASNSTSSQALIDRADAQTAQFTTRWIQPDVAIVAAHGEIDAANSQEFIDYALRHAAHIKCLVLDMSGVEFFGTAGFSALHALNVRCAGESIEWASVPSGAVVRLLRVCDPASMMPFYDEIDSALAAVQGDGADHSS